MNHERQSYRWGKHQFERLLGDSIKTLSPSDRIGIAGCGIAARWVHEILSAHSLQVIVFLDEFPQNSCVDGNVVTPGELNRWNLSVIILSTITANQFPQRLKQAGFSGRLIQPSLCSPATERFELSKSAHDLNGLPGRDWLLNVQIQTQNRCNASCTICPYPSLRKQIPPSKMTKSLYLKLLDDLQHYRLGKFCLYLQNEPFLDNRWFEWAELAIEHLSFKVFEVSSNISPLTPKKCEQLGKLLHKVNHEIWISFHGIDKDSYESIMGLDFEQATKNLRSFVLIAEDYGLNYRLHGFGSPAQGKAKPLFSRADYLAFFERLREKYKLPDFPVHYYSYHDRANSLPPEMRFDKRLRSLKNRYCDRLDTWLHVRCNGDVIACCNDYADNAILGNLNHQDIKAFFHSESYRDFRDKGLGIKTSSGDFMCKKCLFPGG